MEYLWASFSTTGSTHVYPSMPKNSLIFFRCTWLNFTRWRFHYNAANHSHMFDTERKQRKPRIRFAFRLWKHPRTVTGISVYCLHVLTNPNGSLIENVTWHLFLAQKLSSASPKGSTIISSVWRSLAAVNWDVIEPGLLHGRRAGTHTTWPRRAIRLINVRQTALTPSISAAT